MVRLRLIACACAALLVACTGPGDPSDTFFIRLRLDMGTGGCPSTACSDYGMSCGAKLAINIHDEERNLPAVAPECIDVPRDDSLCGLRNISPTTFYGIPPNRVRISVAIWGPGVLPDDRCPDVDIFDSNGEPKEDFMPQPAFGGAVVFDVGTTAEQVEVPLSCTDIQQLETEECTGADTTRVQAEVVDIATILDVTSEQAAELSVGVAPPRQLPGLPASEYIIDGADTIDLDREDGPVPTFATELEEPPGETLCTVVFDRSTSESTGSAVCRDVPIQDPLDVPGVLVDKPTVDAILAALGLEDFPRQGLVIGRVVDRGGLPVAGVSVTPEGKGGSGAVQYLDAELSGVGGTETSTSGYFASTGAPFGTRWTAVHGTDGRREEGEPRAGLVRDKVSPLIVVMQDR